MIISGIDNSKNSPGIVKFNIDDETFKIVREEYLGLTMNKTKKPKISSDPNHLILELNGKDYNDYDKINFMSSNITNFVSDCNYIAFEDYAYMANGRITDLAESVGVLKYLLYNKNISLRFYAPSLIKMFSTTNGAADKSLMIKQYEQIGNPLNLPKNHLEEHPYEDIIDAYFITKLLYTELAIRKGFIKLHELNEQQIRPFNHISASSKVNLLSLDFIQKKNRIE